MERSINTLVFEAETHLNKSLIKKVYIVGALLFLISVSCVLWANANWDAYTEIRYSVKLGTNVEVGLAPMLHGWGWGFAVFIPILYGLMWFTFDFKNPIFAVNKDGVFVNREMFKKTFLRWEEFESITVQENGELWMHLKNPKEVIQNQPRFFRPFLKQTFLKDKSPITIENKEDYTLINAAIRRYNNI